MITWILLVSLFCKSTQDGNGKESGEYIIFQFVIVCEYKDDLIFLTAVSNIRYYIVPKASELTIQITLYLKKDSGH